MQSELARAEGGFGEDWKIEVDEEAESRKELYEQRKRLKKNKFGRLTNSQTWTGGTEGKVAARTARDRAVTE